MHRHAHRRCTVARAFTVAAGCIATACGDGTSGPPVPSASYTMAVASGDRQVARPGTALRDALRVRVLDVVGAPVAGTLVRFTAAGGGVTLLDSTVVTDIDGFGQARAQLSARLSDTAVVAARIAGRSDATIFTATAAGRAPALLSASILGAGDTLVLRGAGLAPFATGDAVMLGGDAPHAEVVSVGGDSLIIALLPACLPPGLLGVRVRSGDALTGLVTTSVPLRAARSLAPGEVRRGDARALDCALLAAGDAEYLLVPQFAGAAALPVPTAFNLGWGGTASTSTIAAGGLRASRAVSTVRQLSGSVRPHPFEQRLRSLERDWARRTSRSSAGDVRDGVTMNALTLGSTRSFRVFASLDADAFVTSVGRLRFMGRHVLVYVDDAAPAGGLDERDIANLGALFDETLYGIGTRAFGSVSDVDANGRVIVLMTPRVNALIPGLACVNGSVVGYFSGFDLVDRGPNSNRGELFYAMTPDPRAEFSCPYSAEQTRRIVPATFIHELQHMISFNQHVLARGGAPEATWLNEGLSHLAEELGSRHFEARYPAPAGRSDAAQLVPDSAQGFMLPNLLNAYDYLAAPAAHSLTTVEGFGTLAERGAGWLFLRWLLDGRDEAVATRALVSTSRTGIANVEQVTGERFDAMIGDFAVALYADSLVGRARTSVASRHRFRTRNLRAVFARLAITYPALAAFPLDAPLVSSGISGSLVPGAAAYARLRTPVDGVRAPLRFTAPGGEALPDALRPRLSVLRLPAPE